MVPIEGLRVPIRKTQSGKTDVGRAMSCGKLRQRGSTCTFVKRKQTAFRSIAHSRWCCMLNVFEDGSGRDQIQSRQARQRGLTCTFIKRKRTVFRSIAHPRCCRMLHVFDDGSGRDQIQSRQANFSCRRYCVHGRQNQEWCLPLSVHQGEER